VNIDLRLDGAARRGVGEGIEAAAAALRAVESGALDPTRARVVGDWVQYKQNFREPVMARPVLGHKEEELELAFDLRRADASLLDGQIAAALAIDDSEAAWLEDFGPVSRSVLWRFNALYWGELALWEEASGRAYAQTLPGGESAATKSEAARAVVLELFRVFDALAERRALPEHLTVLEIGVGNGEQARVWLEEFRRADAEHGREYYRRLQYLMADYSTHVLDLARQTVAEHRDKVSTLALDAAHPRETLRFLDGEVFFVYISNVYDNLPTDELACLDGELHQVEVRAHLPGADVRALAETLGMEPHWVEGLVARLVTLGPRLLSQTMPSVFADAAAATTFWREVWSRLRLAERYRPLGPLDRYLLCEELTGELIEPLTAGQGDVRFHASNGAVSSFLDTLPLLNPYGFLTCHDLFVTDLAQYRSAFRGPGKYDGSVVNWVNGPVLSAAASRRGYHVTFEPFAHGSRSPIVTAVARARD